MNYFELIGKIVVAIPIIFLIAYICWATTKYLIALYTFTNIHVIQGIGVKDDFKNKPFWKIRMFFLLVKSFEYVCILCGNGKFTCGEFCIIYGDTLFPKVTIYGVKK
jgi:hypothetical protein